MNQNGYDDNDDDDDDDDDLSVRRKRSERIFTVFYNFRFLGRENVPGVFYLV